MLEGTVYQSSHLCAQLQALTIMTVQEVGQRGGAVACKSWCARKTMDLRRQHEDAVGRDAAANAV